MKVVIDTNVVVSANLSDHGLPAAILDLAANRVLLMFVSPAILAEYERVLRRSRFALDRSTVAGSLAVIRNISRLVRPSRLLTVAGDEADNRFLECAVSASADYLITGNTRHFPARFEGVRIVTPRQLLEVMMGEPGQNS